MDLTSMQVGQLIAVALIAIGGIVILLILWGRYR